MKLWLLSQRENCGYDTFDSVVVAAETEDEARRIHPYNHVFSTVYTWNAKGQLQRQYQNDAKPELDLHGVWAGHLNRVDVEYLGEDKDGHLPGVVIASFNAG